MKRTQENGKNFKKSKAIIEALFFHLQKKIRGFPYGNPLFVFGCAEKHEPTDAAGFRSDCVITHRRCIEYSEVSEGVI